MESSDHIQITDPVGKVIRGVWKLFSLRFDQPLSYLPFEVKAIFVNGTVSLEHESINPSILYLVIALLKLNHAPVSQTEASHISL